MSDDLELIPLQDPKRDSQRETLPLQSPPELPEAALSLPPPTQPTLAAQPQLAPFERGLAAASAFIAALGAVFTLSVFLRDNSSDPQWLKFYLLKFIPVAIGAFVMGYAGRAATAGAAGMAVSAFTFAIVLVAQIIPGGQNPKQPVPVANASPEPKPSETTEQRAQRQPPSATPTPPAAPVLPEKKREVATPPRVTPPSATTEPAPPPVVKDSTPEVIGKAVAIARPAPDPQMLQDADWLAEAEMSLNKARLRLRECERRKADADAALAEATQNIAMQQKLIASTKENLDRINRDKPANYEVLRQRFTDHRNEALRELKEQTAKQAEAKIAAEKARTALKVAQDGLVSPQRAYDAIVKKAGLEKPPEPEPKLKHTILKLRNGTELEAVKVVDFGTAYSLKDRKGKFTSVEKSDVVEMREVEVE